MKADAADIALATVICIALVILLAFMAAGCSSVSYSENPDGTRKVSRMDLGRDTKGERMEVAGMGFSYSVDSQMESASFKGLVNATERAIVASILAAVTANTSDNAAGVETSRIRNEGGTDRAAIRAGTEKAAIKAGTAELKSVEETKRILETP